MKSSTAQQKGSQAVALKTEDMGLNIGPATDVFYDFRLITCALQASVSTSIEWGQQEHLPSYWHTGKSAADERWLLVFLPLFCPHPDLGHPEMSRGQLGQQALGGHQLTTEKPILHWNGVRRLCVLLGGCQATQMESSV